jgi:hypothetical protein
MWSCPKCNALLVQKNLSHSCGNYTVEGFLDGKPERGKELYCFFLREYEKIGPIILHPVKTRIALMVKVRFASVRKIGNDFIDGTFWLKERVESNKFYKVEFLPKNDYIHYFQIRDESDIDNEFRKYMRMAYQIGERRHLTSRISR